mmetsp:Transcript_29322/g.70760  ORF Transcript_29322/g.70760 Transcript_29322/m.70760 type:complete len:210 (-) Transcript_29322:87-716(-)
MLLPIQFLPHLQYLSLLLTRLPPQILPLLLLELQLALHVSHLLQRVVELLLHAFVPLPLLRALHIRIVDILPRYPLDLLLQRHARAFQFVDAIFQIGLLLLHLLILALQVLDIPPGLAQPLLHQQQLAIPFLQFRGLDGRRLPQCAQRHEPPIHLRGRHLDQAPESQVAILQLGLEGVYAKRRLGLDALQLRFHLLELLGEVPTRVGQI